MLLALRVPKSALRIALHPVGVTPLVYYMLLRIIHLVLSIPVRVFLSRFGLDVRSFSGTSFRGLLLKFRVKETMEINLRVDEIGIDVRTMRRLKVRVRYLWTRVKNRVLGWVGPAAAAEGQVESSDVLPRQPRESNESLPPVVEPVSDAASNSGPNNNNNNNSNGGSGSGVADSGKDSLSKRLQIYAQGVHIQVYVVAPISTEETGDDPLWFDLGKDEQKADADQPGAAADAREKRSDEPVLDRQAQEIAAKLAKRISAILRTYTYIASLFARWVDISVSDISLMVVQSSDLARAGHGVTLHMSNVMLWAESARESHDDSAGWIPTDIMNSIRGIVDGLLRMFKLRRHGGSPEDEPLAVSVAEAATEAVSDVLGQAEGAPRSSGSASASPASDNSSASATASATAASSGLPRPLSSHRRPSSSRSRRDRGLKYLSTVALEVSGIRLFPGIEGVQQHMNSRWELVKMLVMQDMLASKPTSDGDRPHHRGPAINCQRCTIRNDVITTFWGLPKKVDQSIEFGLTHVRAGMIELLLDELAIMYLSPASESSGLPLHRLRALNSHLASVLRQYGAKGQSGTDGSDEAPPPTPATADATSAAPADGAYSESGSATSAKAASAAGASSASADGTSSADGDTPGVPDAGKAHEQVHRMFFQLHEILSKLRLEHVGIALRVAELVFDLPLAPDSHSLAIRVPGMLRWRQRNMEVEAGYLWSAISSASPSTLDADLVFAEKKQQLGEDEGTGSWPKDASESAFIRQFDEGRMSRRSKDSTAFMRVSLGSVQAIALRTPSMTPDPRAEEIAPDAAGFRLRYGTLFGEMSAFLSEDLTHRPSPQPVFSLDIGRPELSLDLHTKLALDEAKAWAKHIGRRARSLRSIFADSNNGGKQSRVPDTAKPAAASMFALSHRLHAFVSLMFADVKAHITIERALYAVRPHVPLASVPIADKGAKSKSNEFIALRMRHMECHVLWNLADPSRQQASFAAGQASDVSVDSDSDSESFATGIRSAGSDSDSNSNSGPLMPSTPLIQAGDALLPKVQFRLTTSPIAAQWEVGHLGISNARSEINKRKLLVVKRGIRARGSVDLHIGGSAHVSETDQMPRVNANIDAEIGELAGMLREYEFRHWLSMQPLWLVTQVMHLCGLDSKGKDFGGPMQSSVSAGNPYHLDPIEERRKVLAATTRVVFENARLTIMACDNEEDVLSGIEHGTQICLVDGVLDLRANGGSIESPHSFGFRPDVGRYTVNLECRQATMFLLAAVPSQSARPEVLEQRQRYSALDGFQVSDLCDYLADDVKRHIALTDVRFNFSRMRLEPFRSRMILDLNTSSFVGLTCVGSVYRWSVFMHHIKYWSRRKKLARRMATQMEVPSPPDDILVYINSEMLDLQGDLVSPKFFSFDKELAQCLRIDPDSAADAKKCPQMKLKVPKVQFSIEKTQQGTDNDLVIRLGGPLVTLYGASTPKGQRTRLNMQPLVSLKQCQITMQYPRKVKKQQLGAEQGVRSNGSYSAIDVVFERGAMAFGHRYNMAETIDGYVLMQKGCKRIARKSTATCYPPLPFPNEALDHKPSVKMVLAALGNPRTMVPPPLRSLSSAKPPPPPTLSEPDDIPKINFHGPEFSIMVHDDPFETALSRIYQVGLQEQRERISRLEAFEAKAQDLRRKREQEFAAQSKIQRKSKDLKSKKSSMTGKSSSRYHHHRHWRQYQSQRSATAAAAAVATAAPGPGNGNFSSNGRGIKGANTFNGASGRYSGGDASQSPNLPPTLGGRRPKLASAQTFTSGQSFGSGEMSPPGNIGGQLRGIASASMQDIGATASDAAVANLRSRGRSYTTASHESNVGGLRHMSSGAGTVGSGDGNGSGSGDGPCQTDEGDENYDDIDDDDASGQEASLHQRMLEAVELEIDAARARLMLVESREWVKAIRRKMMPPPQSSECSCAGAVSEDPEEMHFGEIFDMPSTSTSSHREQECGSPDAKLPYNFVPGSWTHPSAPLGRLVMSPMWLSLDTPLSLLEFDQIESYLRYLDTATPHNLKWTTLIPMRLRIKCGDIRMQLRDFPFPLFRVPDPYRPETARITPSTAGSYEEFYGGIEVSSSLIIAERVAHERSLRSVYIPIGPRSRESGIDMASVGWYLSKSLQFPRIFAAMSIMMFSAPSDTQVASSRSQQQKLLHSRLPPLPIMSAWGASYQPVISALMQRFEAATSKSADVSPSLPWWDKLRSRMHFKCRMAVINAYPRGASASGGDDEQRQRQRRPDLSSADSAYLNIDRRLSPEEAASESESGQMFFLALDGRDPYQVTQKPGSYLFTMRGGVRICINEGIPGRDLWDETSGRGIYSVPIEEGTPVATDMGEFMRLRCEEFLMGVPIIIDRQSAILKSMDQDPPEEVDLTPSMEDISGIVEMQTQVTVGGAAVDQPSAAEPLTWKKAYVDLLHSINSDNSARYTFVTQSVDRLYFKVLLHLSGGVRLGIGLSSFIPPDRAGVRHNHWDVQPIAPECAQAVAKLGITDAYAGYRSTKLHTSISLLCPFTDSQAIAAPASASAQKTGGGQKSFSELYLTPVAKEASGSAGPRRDKPAGRSDFESAFSSSSSNGLLRLRSPDKRILAKEFRKWTAYDTDALVSPMHSLFAVSDNSSASSSTAGMVSGSRRPKAQDLFFVPFAYTRSGVCSEATPSAFAANAQPSAMATKRATSKPQCQISASAAIVEGVQRYLPLYVSRMMLPVRKGSLYPFTETSDNKLGKCLRSMRLVLDLTNVELAYSQRDFEIKELETRELGVMGYKNDVLATDAGLSPTPSDISSGTGHSAPGAKIEGTVRELKARVDSFSFNLLMEQTSIKLNVGSDKLDDATARSDGPPSDKKHFSRPRSGSTDTTGVGNSMASRSKKKSEKAKKSDSPLDTSSRKSPETKKAPETKALRWGMGDASTEIDYLDVRLTQMTFAMPLFANPLAMDGLDRGRRLNGLRFVDGALNGLSEFEQSWISCDSIRDLKEIDISDAVFSGPSVVCVLWSPRMVYFTQRPGWTQFGSRLDEILDSNLPGPGPYQSPEGEFLGNDTPSRPATAGGAGVGGFPYIPPSSLDSALASMPTALSELQPPNDQSGGSFNASAQKGIAGTQQRGRALSDVKSIGRLNRAQTTALSTNTLMLPSNDSAKIGSSSSGGGGGKADSVSDQGSGGPHRRNTSMPWLLSKSLSHDGGASSRSVHGTAKGALPAQLPSIDQVSASASASASSKHGWITSSGASLQPVAASMQRATTQPNVSGAWPSLQRPQQQQQHHAEAAGGSVDPSPLLQPNASLLYNPSAAVGSLSSEAAANDVSNEVKSPASTMSYKSSFHLLELARSRQRRLTASHSRQSINPLLASSGSVAQTIPESPISCGYVDLQRQPSLALDPALASTQSARLAPSGPDPNVIMRDSRTTQAMLLQKRKLMLGTAIQHEQTSLAHLSREFERASSRHGDKFRKEMIRRAEHIYELGARRKLINRCLRFLGVDPDASDSEHMADGIPEPTEDEMDFDRDTQEVEKVLATLYRHRCLIYSGYLIWTTQVRDKLMRFLYIQDCLTAIEYYLSESATKVARNVALAKDASNLSSAGGNVDAPLDASMGGATRSSRSNSMATNANTYGRRRAVSNATAGSAATGDDRRAAGVPRQAPRAPSTRTRRQSSDQHSVASGSSRQTSLHLPNILRKLRSSERLGGSGGGSGGSGGGSGYGKISDDLFGLGSLFRSRRSSQKKQSSKHKHSQKHREGKGHKSKGRDPDKMLSKRSAGKNKFDKGLKGVWDDFVRYRPYYSILVEFLNSQVSMRVDENTSTTSAIAVAERVQLHRILLCNEEDDHEDASLSLGLFGADSSHVFMNPPNDESIVKTRSLVELENVQVFTAKRDDFEHQAAYFVDCTYGSRIESSDASQMTAIWPAWIPIELLLSQGKHRARGIFDELADAENEAADSDSDSSDQGSSISLEDHRQQPENSGSRRRRHKHKKAWWLEDLSKYKRLMDRNNGLVVYDKANPHRIQGDSTGVADDIDVVAANAEAGGAGAAADMIPGGQSHADNAAGKNNLDSGSECESCNGDNSGSCESRDGTSDEDSDGEEEGNPVDEDHIDFDFDRADMAAESAVGSSGGASHGLTHRANHFSVFLPELNLACTAEQYTAVYETVTELLVFIDPEKTAYMDHLNTILLGMDMDDLRGLLAVISATQGALRERLPIIQDWYAIHRSHNVLLRDAGRAVATEIDSRRQRSRAMSLLTLDRHRRALELQLRTAMDLFGAAQKQMRQQHRLEALAGHGGSNEGSFAAHAAASKSHLHLARRPTAASSAGQAVADAQAPGSEQKTASGPQQHRLRSRANTAQSAGSMLRSSLKGDRKPSTSIASRSSLSSSSGMRSIEGAQTTIARTIHLFISKATWHMLENDGQPLCDVTLRWATLKAVTTSDQATHLLSEVHLLYVVNRLPNPMFTDLVGPYVRPKYPKPDFCVEKMIRVRWSELAPVGGISIVERFEVDLYPLRLQLSHDIAQKLINYLYPPQDSSNNTFGAGHSGRNSRADLASGTTLTRNRRPTISSVSSADGSSGSQRPATLSPAHYPASSSSALTSTTMDPSVTSVPVPGLTAASGGGSSSFATSAEGPSGGRSLLMNRMMRRNIADDSVRSSPAPDDRQLRPLPPLSSPHSGVSVGLLATMSGRNTSFSLLPENKSMINISQSSENRDQVDQMKKRASSNKTFLNIKIGASTLCISYQGKKTNNITDLRDFEFHAPKLELRNQVESYYELLMQVKKEYMSVVVQHTGALVKEKLRQLHNRKAWSKTSFGPDWEARRLLIDMDRRVDEEMAASVNDSLSEREGFGEVAAHRSDMAFIPDEMSAASAAAGDAGDAAIAGLQTIPSDSSLDNVQRLGVPSVTVSDTSLRMASARAGDQLVATDSNDDAASVHSTKSKAPLSKYMILDPRKLMGKRIPNVLPRNIARTSGASSAAASRSQTPAHLLSPTQLPASGNDDSSGLPPLSPASSTSSTFRSQIYSSMHMDILPAASMRLAPSPKKNSAGKDPQSQDTPSPSRSKF
ncbi:Protein SABRE [Coemansia sp. RSA 2599]|nr:Protein SABRE [Coemansia sp. RSA 2599]